MSASIPLDYPLRHVSIRVPWHDAGWSGTVCNAPHLNGACAKLKRIADKKDELERPLAGCRVDDLPPEQWPPCVEERGAFMAPFTLEHLKRHALSTKDTEHYGHFLPTLQRYPAYSAGIVPFLWMMRENIPYYRDIYGLDADLDREPDFGYHQNWVNEFTNQKALLDAFAAHLRIDDSLCLFYAKHVPFFEGTSRVLIGVGRVKHIGSLTEYDRAGGGMRGMIWERAVQHSIRPTGKDGFLFPYRELLQRFADDPSLDLNRYTARAPEDHWDEFSFGSELVSHDGAISALLSLTGSLELLDKELGIATGWQRDWLHDELVRLWKVRGPYPGLGAVLAAFGLSRGVFVAHALQQKAGDNADPWPLVDAAFADPASVLPKALHLDLPDLASTWHGLPGERKAFLRLLSRFELSKDQAVGLYEAGSRLKRGWGGADAELLANPYRIFEVTRHDPSGVPFVTLDRGVFPDDAVRLLHPLPEPSRVDSAVDVRRVKALVINALEEAANTGHTLLPRKFAVETIQAYPLQPACPVTGDILLARAGEMRPDVVTVDMDDDIGLQLARYEAIREQVRNQVLRRIDGQRHTLTVDWAARLEHRFGPAADDEERRARQEKAAALKELAESRFSVLAGPAGAGKTTVLGFLCAQDAIRSEGVLLLAPTGKARVRMQELAAGNAARALTLAQFLYRNGRYDGRTQRYITSDKPKATGYGTVIVDEASMLTEDMLGALFDALQGVKRFIFVGDPAQLPPIGAGRPFVDIIARLRPPDYESRFPRVAKGYAELTIERRQVGHERPDLRLARWFSSTVPGPGEDDIFSSDAALGGCLRFVEWQKPEDFYERLVAVLVEELRLSGPGDLRGFNRALGATPYGEYDYFNATRNGQLGAVASVEAWQVLSPLHGMPFGISEINRRLHDEYRVGFLQLTAKKWPPIPKPLGSERIVYGDKVMVLSNQARKGFPTGGLDYLANGEVGIAIGQWVKDGRAKFLNIEFSSQPGYTYGFTSGDFGEEANPALELAYALTVHKSQGSQFNLVILVLPEAHPILSRELVYTALTRHQSRVVVMHQGPRTGLKDLASPHRSETARRMTNLLQTCRMVEVPQPRGSVFLQEGLIHRTSRGLAVRSKSELIIADKLAAAGVAFEYEKPLTLAGHTRYPDFTIEDEITGRTIYWEHLGMLDRPHYALYWQSKLSWYRANGVLPAEEGSGSAGMLLTTTDSPAQGFDALQIDALIHRYLLS